MANEVISHLGFDFTYKIKSLDIEHGTMVIEFDPVDPELLPIELNCLFHEKVLHNIDGTVQPIEATFEESLEFTVKSCAPIASWRRHKLMLGNIDTLTSKM